MTKDELSQIYWLRKEVIMWQSRLESLRSQSLMKGQEITGMPSGGSRTTSKIEERMIKIVEIEERIKELRDRADREEARLLRYIEEIGDSFVRQIIQYRFLELKTWKGVADCMGGDNTSESVRKALYRFLKK